MSNKKPIPPVVNRKQMREYEKILGKKYGSKEEMNAVINVINMMDGFSDMSKFKECLLEGDKVKLNVPMIKSHPDWIKHDSEYKKFVEDNDGVEFTVEYDENKKDKPSVVQLKEDTSRQKWLFWDGNLLVLHKGKFRELYTIIEDEEDEYGFKIKEPPT